MKQRVGIRFLESGNSLVGGQSRLTKALGTRFRERALMQFAVRLDLADCIRKRWCDFVPLVVGEHRQFHATAPAVDRPWHMGLTTKASGGRRASVLGRLVKP